MAMLCPEQKVGMTTVKTKKYSYNYYFFVKAVYCMTKKERSDSTEKKLKRRHEGIERRMRKTPAPRKKRVKTLQSKGLCTREQRLDRDSDSNSSFTSESEDENAICPADHCMEPEGDEVGFRIFFFSHFVLYFHLAILLTFLSQGSYPD